MDGRSAFQGDTGRFGLNAHSSGGEGQGWDLRTQNCSFVRHTLVKFVKTVFSRSFGAVNLKSSTASARFRPGKTCNAWLPSALHMG
jgi:hypothetical protein